MSAQTLETIQAKRLAFLKVLKPVAPLETSQPVISTDDPKDYGEKKEERGLPLPPTPKDVADIIRRYEASEKYLTPARDRLAKGQLPDTADWGLVLYQLFIAWIINLGRDPLANQAKKAAQAGDLKGAATLLGQSQEFIVQAATALNLEWIPFIDLALIAFDDSVEEGAEETGPFGGVFVSKGEFPFMILAFKGTTYAGEVNTDKKAGAVKPLGDILYGERVHAGMYQGLFEPFLPEFKQGAFEIILQNLELVAKDIQSTKKAPVPLYVTGHSLGGGYGDLAYIELIRRLPAETTSYALRDLWTFGAPRVGLDSLAARVKKLLADTGRHLWRITRINDIVPTIPHIILVDGVLTTYKHFDGGYKLRPNGVPPYVTPRLSEIGGPIYNDLLPNLRHHWPWIYYDAIRQVLDGTAQ